MTKEEFKNNMATIRTALKNSTGTRATVLCMAVAATRGHVHCEHVWQRLDGWREKGKDLGNLASQRAFIVSALNLDPWGKRTLTSEELVRILLTIEAADAFRAEWAARLREAIEVEQEQPVTV